jgi:hypothetical protein
VLTARRLFGSAIWIPVSLTRLPLSESNPPKDIASSTHRLDGLRNCHCGADPQFAWMSHLSIELPAQCHSGIALACDEYRQTDRRFAYRQRRNCGRQTPGHRSKGSYVKGLGKRLTESGMTTRCLP